MTAAAGQTLSYTIHYSNAGTIGSTGVVVTETVPVNTTYNAAASTAGWTLVSGSTYQFSVGTLNATSATGTLVFAVTVNSSLPNGTNSVSDTVSIADDGVNGADANTLDNTASKTTNVAVAPNLASAVIGDGSVQRSSISSLTVTFDSSVNFTASSFTLFQETLNADGSINTGAAATDVSAGISASSSDGKTWLLKVIAGGILDRTAASTAAGILADGIFQLMLHGANITDAATGSARYNSGGNQIVSFTSAEAGGPSNYFHSLFGDTNGDGSINLTDYRQFKLDYLASIGDPNYAAALDYDGDGSINLTDYRKFKNNYLNSFSY